MPNIEIKARYPELARARVIAVEAGAKFLWKDTQVDTYFVTKQGKLKLRESSLNGAELIPYAKSESEGIKRSDYARIPIADVPLVKALFHQLLGTKIAVTKLREVYLLGNIRVHLDEVERLGSFLEFEAVFESESDATQTQEREKIRALMHRFHVSDEELLQGSYPDLLAEKA